MNRMPQCFYHHEHTHTHTHTHDGVEHTHEHTHHHHHEGEELPHSHEGEHGAHDHAHECAHDCGACAGGCDPMTETLALMQYMVNHNAAHARELAGLAEKLKELGNQSAAEQVLTAVSEFEKGNLRLSTVLASLK